MTSEQTTFESLAELIGKEGALSLSEQYGGETLYIRKSVVMDDGIRHPWLDFIGAGAAQRLIARLGGKRVYIPSAPPELLAERNAVIAERLQKGESANAVAEDFRLTPRRVSMILQHFNNQ